MTRFFKFISGGLVAALMMVAISVPQAAHAQQILNGDTYIPADVARQALFQSAADALGISEDDLLAQLTGDKTLQDVINDDGGNVEQIEQQAQQAAKDKVAALVSSGLISKDAGDKILDGMDTRVDVGLKQDRALAAEELQDRLSRQALLQVTETATGLTDNQIADQLAKGKTFEQIIRENGGNVDDVVDTANEQFKDSVQNLVKNGDLPQHEADKVTDGFEKKMDFQAHQDTTLHDRIRRDIITDHALIDQTAKATGLTPDQVRDQLRSGKTFDEIARANGGKIEEIQRKAGEQIRDDTQKLVNAGVIGKVQADYLTHGLDKRLDYVGHHKQPHQVIHPIPLRHHHKTHEPEPTATQNP